MEPFLKNVLAFNRISLAKQKEICFIFGWVVGARGKTVCYSRYTTDAAAECTIYHIFCPSRFAMVKSAESNMRLSCHFALSPRDKQN